jgi:hypothetical protein
LNRSDAAGACTSSSAHLERHCYCIVIITVFIIMMVMMVIIIIALLLTQVTKSILKRLFRVYAHIYHAHFEKVCQLEEERHLNTYVPSWCGASPLI